MNSLRYLKENEVNKDLDNLFFTSLMEFKRNDGEICLKCNIVQGKPFKGWSRYYCKHLEKEINNKLRDKQEEVLNKILNLVTQKEQTKEGSDNQ